MLLNVQSFQCTYNTTTYIHSAIPLAFPLPLPVAPCLPFVSPSTYLAPSSCDRNRPPLSQVACKLTPFAPPFTQLTHPLQIPRTPTAPRLTMTTSGIFRLLLSGTGQTFPRTRFYCPLSKCVLCWGPTTAPLSSSVLCTGYFTTHLSSCVLFKGTVARDFWPLLFSIKRTYLGPWFMS